MDTKLKIAVVGLGGVGGYLGAQLAAYYAASDRIQIYFVSRGENLPAIKAAGLKLLTDDTEKTLFPFSAVAADEFSGIYDVVICCVKSYDLEKTLDGIKHCISDSTVILPFLNGVDASERIVRKFPLATVLSGCCYIVARLEAPGQIKVTGPLKQFYIGSQQGEDKKSAKIASIFSAAGIDTQLSENISGTLWTKFLFISPFATLTSALDTSLGAILANKEHKKKLLDLMGELKLLAEMKGVVFEAGIIDALILKMSLIPYEATSSLHSDLKRSNRAELDTITTYVVREGDKLSLPVHGYRQALSEIRRRWNLILVK